MKQYKSRSGEILYKPSIKQLERMISSNDNQGFCLACGDIADGVEPDARKYTCESCDKNKVYGAEELMLMGLCY